MDVLVTGAAGYVGSVTAEELLKQGHRVVVFDNLVQGHREAVTPGAAFVYGDLTEAADVEALFAQHEFEMVLHMAAETVVEMSMTDPHRFFYSNVAGTLNLLNAMLRHGVSRIVFSSTAAVYGKPVRTPILEDDPHVPINPYGESKLMVEQFLRRYHDAYGIKAVALRYFNACGASVAYGEAHHPESHLIPIVLQAALGQRDCVCVFGEDHDTSDGSCVRDYVHVLDIAQAHILALENVDRLGLSTYNLGNGTGYSVLEVIQTVREVTGRAIVVKSAPRRAGDPAELIASAERIEGELGWKPRYSDLSVIVESAWRWQREHPRGYATGS